MFPANSQIQARQFLQFKWSGFPSKPKQTLLCPLKYVRNVQILRCDSHYQLNTSKILGQNVKYTSSFWTLTETLQVMQMTHTNSNTRTTVNGIRRKTTNVENIMKCCINSTSQNSSNLYPKKTQTKNLTSPKMVFLPFKQAVVVKELKMIRVEVIRSPYNNMYIYSLYMFRKTKRAKIRNRL